MRFGTALSAQTWSHFSRLFSGHALLVNQKLDAPRLALEHCRLGRLELAETFQRTEDFRNLTFPVKLVVRKTSHLLPVPIWIVSLLLL